MGWGAMWGSLLHQHITLGVLVHARGVSGTSRWHCMVPPITTIAHKIIHLMPHACTRRTRRSRVHVYAAH